MATFDDEMLRAGVWSGTLTREADEGVGRLVLVHLGEIVARADAAPLEPGRWRVSVRVPLDRVTDGASSFTLYEDAGAAEVPGLQSGAQRLAVLPIVAGRVLEGDLRAELSLLRAEIELIKREFRRRLLDGAA